MDINAFFKLSYGLYIISSKSGDQMGGYIANTAFQVTAEPPQVAISCHKDNATTAIINASKSFAISVLEKEASADLIGLFGYSSGKDKNKFEQTKYTEGITGSPIVTDECIAYFECELIEQFDVGTHILFIGKVVDSKLLNESLDPLTYAYYRDAKKGAAPKNAPTYVDKSKLNKEPETEPNEKGKDLGPSFICEVCSYSYDPAEGDESQGIPPGTSFADLPDDWVCPICAAGKIDFVAEE
jgi:flavin reductase (DIM6/NTAB) family NADH-FMN oxidoreductase RutF/rubredoxin